MSRINNVQLGAALWGVLLGLGLAIAIAACSSGKRAQTPVAAGPDAAIARTDIDPRKQDITKLWNEIRDWRVARSADRFDQAAGHHPEPGRKDPAVPERRRATQDRRVHRRLHAQGRHL